MQKSIDDIFIQKIKDKKIKVVSFDIFETLAFRDVADPKEIFKKVGKKKYVKKIFGDANIFRLARVEAEKTARKKYSRFEEVTLQQIYEQLPLQSEQREKILDLEIEQEYKSLYINPQIKRWIDLAIQHKKQIIFISDMYLSTQQIEHLVMSKLDSYKDTSKIFVSNEHQATKATGKLFQLVLESLKISNDEILHIGDNFHMDIEMAKSKNITALFYNNDKYVNEILEVESHYAGQFFNKGFHQRKLACIQNNYAKEKERFFFNLGASVFGPILWEFSHWLIDIAKQQKITQINCVMREGRIFKKFLEKLDNDLDINLVYASRKSTFLPSIDIANNSFDFHHYRKLTIKDFYELFRLKITDTFIDSHKTILFSEASEYILNKKNLMQAVIEDFKKKKEQSLEKIKKEIDQLEKEKGEIKKKTDSEIEKEVENEIKNGDNEEHKRILQRRGIRKDYADSIRKKWFTLLSQADKDEIAMVAEKGTDKEKKKLLEEYYERAKAKRKEKSDYDKEHPSSSSETPPSAH